MASQTEHVQKPAGERQSQPTDSKNKASYTITISDHLISEDMLRQRLARIFKVEESSVQYIWSNGCFKIHNAPVKELTEAEIDVLRL